MEGGMPPKSNLELNDFKSSFTITGLSKEFSALFDEAFNATTPKEAQEEARAQAQKMAEEAEAQEEARAQAQKMAEEAEAQRRAEARAQAQKMAEEAEAQRRGAEAQRRAEEERREAEERGGEEEAQPTGVPAQISNQHAGILSGVPNNVLIEWMVAESGYCTTNRCSCTTNTCYCTFNRCSCTTNRCFYKPFYTRADSGNKDTTTRVSKPILQIHHQYLLLNNNTVS